MHKQRTEKFSKALLYPVVSGPELSAGRDFMQTISLLLKGGASLVQLRAKHESDQRLYGLAKEARELTAAYDALLIIDDRLDIAMAVGADGVHLGQDDMPVVAARALAPDMLIGASTHCLEEAAKAQADGASYVNIGAIYPTKTKGGLTSFLGPAAISQIAPTLHVPFSVMGGIKPHNVAEVVAHGATLIAVVTAVTAAPDPTEAFRSFKELVASLVASR